MRRDRTARRASKSLSFCTSCRPRARPTSSRVRRSVRLSPALPSTTFRYCWSLLGTAVSTVLILLFARGRTADEAGWVAVNNATTQSTKFANIFSLGDASSMPNSKTAAAITSQAPVLVDNIRAAYDGKELPAKYDGYASCPLLTGHNELMYVCLIRMRGVSNCVVVSPDEEEAPDSVLVD